MDAQAVFNLMSVLEHDARKSNRPQSSVLFQRGENAFGIFLVLSGKVKLDLGVDNGHGYCYGRGALLGLPETLTKSHYNMTATVIQDAEIGFIASTDLRTLLNKSRALCSQLLTLLNQRGEKTEKKAEMNNEVDAEVDTKEKYV